MSLFQIFHWHLFCLNTNTIFVMPCSDTSFALFFYYFLSHWYNWMSHQAQGELLRVQGQHQTDKRHPVLYCDSLWLYRKSWKNGYGIDKCNLSGNNKFIFLICLKFVCALLSLCVSREGKCTKHNHDFSIQSLFFFLYYWYSTWHAL